MLGNEIGSIPVAPIPRHDLEGLHWSSDRKFAIALVMTLDSLPEASLGFPGLRDFTGTLGDPLSSATRVATHVEYGMRVGVFRLAELVMRFGLPLSVAISADVAERYPFVVKWLAARGFEFLAYGRSSQDLITSDMTLTDERRYIRDALDRISSSIGRVPTGWQSPGYSESISTIGLLGEAGIEYILDWSDRDVPYLFRTPGAGVLSLPTAPDYSDLLGHLGRHVPIHRYCQVLTEASEYLASEGRAGSLMIVTVRPWIMGQAFRARRFGAVLEQWASMPEVWMARCSDVTETIKRSEIYAACLAGTEQASPDALED